MAKEDYKGIWVFAEQENGIIEPTVFELIAKSKDLQAYNKEEIVAVLLGSGIENLAQDLIARGADKVIVVDDPALAEYSARPYAEALRQLIEKHKPSIVLYGATPEYNGATPTKASTVDKVFTFANTWSPAVEAASGNVEYTANTGIIPWLERPAPKVTAWV